MKLDWENWLYGLWVAVVGGMSNSVVAGLGLNIIDPKDWNARQSQFWWFLAGLMAVSAVKDFFLYLAQHPAPAVFKAISETTQTNPKTGVQTTTVSSIEQTAQKVD